MIGTVWLVLLAGGVFLAAATGDVPAVTDAATRAAGQGVQLVISLAGVMALWMGLLKIAERSGLMQGFARLLYPLVRRLFSDIPAGHPALGAVIMNLSANMLGMGSAATPLGLRAMQELQTLNRGSETASRAMCTFLALNTSAFTLVPGTVIALRAAAGAAQPADIVLPALLASLTATCVGVGADLLCRCWWTRR